MAVHKFVPSAARGSELYLEQLESYCYDLLVDRALAWRVPYVIATNVLAFVAGLSLMAVVVTH